MDRNGDPIMFAAVTNDRTSQIELLVRFGGDIDFTDRMGGNSALHGAHINRYEMVHYLIEQGIDYGKRDSGGGDVAWDLYDKLSNNLLNPEFSAYGWALKVKQQLIDRGVKFPPPSPREVRWSEGKPNKNDIEIRTKELKEALSTETDASKKEALLQEMEKVQQQEIERQERVRKIKLLRSLKSQ